MRTLAEALNQFVYHPATEQTAPKHHTVRSTVIDLARRWWDTLPDGAEKTLAFRKLQEAAMYANLAVALMAPAAEPGTEDTARVLPETQVADPAAASYPPDLPINKATDGALTTPEVHPADAFPPLDPTVKQAYTGTGTCIGPIAVGDGRPGLKKAICYYGLCDWASEDIEPGMANLKALQLEHDEAASTLR